MAKGIDLDHNRFLILQVSYFPDLNQSHFLQGEVESIAQMKPKAAKAEDNDGLLEYLEDIIGTSDYKPKLKVLEEELEEINVIRSEKLNRVKVVENDKNALEVCWKKNFVTRLFIVTKKDGKNEAESYIKNENELARKKNLLFQVLIYRSNKAISGHEVQIGEFQQRLDDEKEKYKGSLEALKKMESECDMKEKELEVTLQIWKSLY